MKALLFILFFTTGLYAQDLEYLKSQDTVFLYIPKNYKSDYTKFAFRTENNSRLNGYHFTQADGKDVYLQTVNDREVDTIKRNFTVKKRAFFKKNKERIVSLEFLDNKGLAAFFMGILKTGERWKTLYIINEKDIKKKQVTVKRAAVLDTSFWDI